MQSPALVRLYPANCHRTMRQLSRAWRARGTALSSPVKPREPSRSSNFGNTPTRNNTLMRVLSSSVVCNPRQYAGEEAEEAEERDATQRGMEKREGANVTLERAEYEQRGCVRERSRKIEKERGGGEVPGINHNYNQRARKLHQSDPLWPPRLWWLRRCRMKIYRPTSVSFKVGRATLHTSLFHFFASFRKESLVESSRAG